MANTTNFNWETPDDTDLVKDGAAAIRTLGSAIDTSLVDLKGGTTNQVLAKNSNTDMDFKWVADAAGMTNPMTTTGDTIYSSSGSTPARLAIGSTGNVLTVAGGVPTWAAPAGASGLTFISRTTFSGVASQAIDNVFTTSYENYLVIIDDFFAVTAENEFQLQMRYGSTTETGNVYNGNALTTNRANTTITNTAFNDTNPFQLGLDSGDSNQKSSITLNFSGVGNTNENARWYGTGHIGATSYGGTFFSGAAFANRTYTGFLLKSSSTNISGAVTVYGLAKS